MNPFDMIGDEELYQMCEKWDDRVLLNMSQTHKRIGIVCNKIINSRKNKYLKIKKIENAFINYNSVKLEAVFGNHISEVNIHYNPDNPEVADFSIFQLISPVEGSENVPLVVPNPQIDGLSRGRHGRRREWNMEYDPMFGFKLAKNLYDQGYKITSIDNFPVEKFNLIHHTDY